MPSQLPRPKLAGSGDAAPGDSSPRRPPAKKAPAKKAPAKKAPAKKAPAIGGGGAGGRPSNADLRSKLQGSIEKGAGALLLAGQVAGRPELVWDAKVIGHQAPVLARELLELSKSNDTVRRMIESFYATGKQLDHLTVILGTVVPIMVGHGLLPREALAVPGVGGSELVDAIGQPPTPRPPAAKKAPAGREPSPEEEPPNPRPWAGYRDQVRGRRPDATPAEASGEVLPPPPPAPPVQEAPPAPAAPEVSTLDVPLDAFTPPGL